MAVNLNEAVNAIKRVGATNARVVPMPGQRHDGQQQIEIREGNEWIVVASGLSTRMANDIIQQATNRVILG